MMRNSYRILRVRGIDISLHITLLILFLMPLLDLADGIAAAAYSFAFLLALFTSVLLHELAHSLVAMRNGVRVKQIILTPIGGIASVGFVKGAFTELKISLAGPLMSLGIAFFALLLLAGTTDGATLGKAFASGSFMAQPSLLNFLILVTYLNFILGIFNLFIPIFPMDGGRVLRAMLCMLTGKLKATRIAVYVGQAFLSMLFVFGLMGGSIWVMAIAVFLFIAGVSELKLTEAGERLKQADISRAVVGNFIMLDPGLRMSDFKKIAVERQSMYPVVDCNGKPLGVVERSAAGETALDAMSTDFATALPNIEKEELIAKVYSNGYALMLDGEGRLCGILTSQNLQKALKPAA